MRVVNAVWEKRNLGVETTEVVLSSGDEINEIIDVLSHINSPYSVVKVPSGCIEQLRAVQQYGYMFVETLIELEGRVSDISLPKLYYRFESSISVEEASDDMCQKILSEVRMGEIFDTDRIALDDHFSTRVAGERYYNWACDELNRGAKASVAYYKDEPVAFGISKCIEGTTFDGILSGLFSNKRNAGLGFLAIYALNETIRLQGGKKIIGRVSSNNPAILRLQMQYGYEVTGMKYVLVKHRGI